MLSTLTHVSITLGSGRIAGVGWSMIVLSGGIFQYKINLYFWFEKHSINEKYDYSVNLMICFVWSGFTQNKWLNSPNNHTWSGHSVGKFATFLGASLLRDVCARTRRARRRAARRRVALDELQQRLEHAALRRQEECQRSGRCSALFYRLLVVDALLPYVRVSALMQTADGNVSALTRRSPAEEYYLFGVLNVSSGKYLTE